MAKPLPADLSEDQIQAILSATRPLPIADRDAFLDDVADALDGVELGDGAVYRTIKDVQRRYWDPPQAHHWPDTALCGDSPSWLLGGGADSTGPHERLALHCLKERGLRPFGYRCMRERRIVRGS